MTDIEKDAEEALLWKELRVHHWETHGKILTLKEL